MSNKNDSLGDRMKRYEGVSRNFLTRRVPVVIRLDGKAFHTFTRGMKKPFDRILMNAMQETMKCLCKNVQGCVFTESSIQGALEFDYSVYESKFGSAMFDARAFSVPVDDVCNCLIWRQQDATRNSIEAVGQANFSHKELQGKSCNDIQEMLWSQCNLNWNDFPVDCKRGSCCYRQWKEVQMQDPRDSGKTITVSRREWVIDREPPIFTQDRDYVERWL